MLVAVAETHFNLRVCNMWWKSWGETSNFLSHNIKEDWLIRNQQNKRTAYSYITDIPGFSSKVCKGHFILLCWFMTVVWSMENIRDFYSVIKNWAQDLHRNCVFEWFRNAGALEQQLNKVTWGSESYFHSPTEWYIWFGFINNVWRTRGRSAGHFPFSTHLEGMPSFFS